MKLTKVETKMAKIQKIDLKSKDIKSEQVERLKAIFPEAVADGKINFEQLKATLGEDIEDSRERFGMTWAGKSKCFRIIQDPSTGTLKPCREDSINFDSTKNLFIEGDNLEVLKLIQKSYYEKVKMIYIDPPYNTGKDFVYPDKFGEQVEQYLRITGQVDEEGKKTSTNTDTDGRFHSNWMNMMYPRLFLARNLLKNNGVIFISIDDNELDNLKKVCNEIFGENNFIAQLNVITGANQSGDGVLIQKNVEYCLVYAKSISECTMNKIDETAETFRNLNDAPSPLDTRLDMGYTIYFNKSTGDLIPKKDYDKSKVHLNTVKEVYSDDKELINKNYIPIRPGMRNGKLHRWRWGMDTFIERKDQIEVLEKRGNYSVCFKQSGFNAPKNIHNFTVGTLEIKDIFDGQKIFDYPKGTKFLKYLIGLGTSENDIVLDFFAGSGTTAHAILDLNKEVGSNRKFICVQLPELLDKQSDQFKAGYKTIADISKARITKVIQRIDSDEPKNQKTLTDKESSKMDLGFKVFKLDKSNFKIWDNEPSTLQTSLTDHVEQIKKSANPEEVLYEVLLKDGFELTTNVKKTKIKDKDVFSIENDLLLVCLDEKLDLNLFKEMKKLNPHVVIVLDKGFKDNDQLKTNAVQTLGKNSDEEYILRSI
jgi:adenine-specific DNA-methyltransferase